MTMSGGKKIPDLTYVFVAETYGPWRGAFDQEIKLIEPKHIESLHDSSKWNHRNFLVINLHHIREHYFYHLTDYLIAHLAMGGSFVAFATDDCEPFKQLSRTLEFEKNSFTMEYLQYRTFNQTFAVLTDSPTVLFALGEWCKTGLTSPEATYLRGLYTLENNENDRYSFAEAIQNALNEVELDHLSARAFMAETHVDANDDDHTLDDLRSVEDEFASLNNVQNHVPQHLRQLVNPIDLNANSQPSSTDLSSRTTNTFFSNPELTTFHTVRMFKTSQTVLISRRSRAFV